MWKIILLSVLAFTVYAGCETSGNREFKPGQGWTPVLPPPPVPTP